MSLLGTIGEVKLADVLRLLATGKKTGLLTVGAPPQKAAFRFEKGQLVHATAGRLGGDDAVLDVFGWTKGDLVFVVDETPAVPNVQRPVDTLILEGIRSGPAVHRMHELIPSDRVCFQMGAGPADESVRVAIGRTEWRVLRVLDGVRDVREVVEASKVARADVLRILFELAEAGFLQKVEGPKSLRVQSQGLFGKDTAAVDEKHERDWTAIRRFSGGVRRVEVRTLAGKAVVIGVEFRPGLFRDVHLPRATVAELGVREGDDVVVRPT
jgi:hypothetical protein